MSATDVALVKQERCVYSLYVTIHHVPRAIKDGKLYPVRMVGSANLQGESMDMGEVFASPDELVLERCQRYFDGLDEHYNKRVFLPNDESARVYSMFRHTVDAPGTYYGIEYKVIGNKRMGNYSFGTMSKLYKTKSEARQTVNSHFREEYQGNFGILTTDNEFSDYIFYIADNGVTELQYVIYRLDVSDDVYSRANNQPYTDYLIQEPSHYHFT